MSNKSYSKSHRSVGSASSMRSGSAVRSSRNANLDRFQSNGGFEHAVEETIQLELLDVNKKDISHKLPRSLINPEVRLDKQFNQTSNNHLGASKSTNGMFSSASKISSTMLLGGGNKNLPSSDDMSSNFPLKSIMQRTSSVLDSPLISRSRISFSAADSSDNIPVGGGNLGDFGAATDAVAGISNVTTVRQQASQVEDVDEASLDKQVSLELSESEMIWMYDSVGSFVAEDGEWAEEVKVNNERYAEYLKKLEGSRDWLSDRYSQTLHGRPKHKDTQMTSVAKASIGCGVSESSIHDAFKQLKEQEMRANRAVSGVARKTTKFDAAAKTRLFPDTMKEIDESRGALWSGALKTAPSIIEETSDSRHHADTPGIMVAEEDDSDGELVGKESYDGMAVVEDKAALQRFASSESFKASLVNLERLVVNSNPKYALGQHLFRSSQHEDPAVVDQLEEVREALASEVEAAKPPVVEGEEADEDTIDPSAPHLDTLWEFGCDLTQGRKVLCMAWNKSNENILAAGYGSLTGQSEAIVCAWSYKNPKFPDRVYKLPSQPCSVAFCSKWPGLLGVGLENGEVVIFDVGTNSTDPICTSQVLDVMHRHSQPIWGLTWVSQTQEGTSETKDVLVSACMGGSVRKWDFKTKGLMSSELMAVNRATSKEPRVTSNAKSNHTAYLKKEGSCMSLQFYPEDPLLYLVGSEDGIVYKNSCSYSEQSLDTFTGHSGPVYSMAWSPFEKGVFLTCSADWTLRIWDEKTKKSLKVLQPSTTAVTDCAWSPRTATVLAAVSNSCLAIWDLGVKDFDPIITVTAKQLNASPTTVSFSTKSNAITYGDDKGHICVSMLCNMPNSNTELRPVLTKII